MSVEELLRGVDRAGRGSVGIGEIKMKISFNEVRTM
jgi:hypothetical protein